MCGIFGLIAYPDSGFLATNISRILKNVASYSESRGKDSSGIAFRFEQQDKIEVIKGDDSRKFIRKYDMTSEAEPSVGFLKSKFADLPSAGIWADRTESDDELLEELGSGWRGFAT